MKTMKTKEAPEKIYINPNLENRMWLIGKGDISFIEYVRADAFIEKACKFLKDKGSAYITIKDGQLVLRKGFVKDFRNYMEK